MLLLDGCESAILLVYNRLQTRLYFKGCNCADGYEVCEAHFAVCVLRELFRRVIRQR